MRLWSFHPKYLDQKGLCGLWREGLGALKSIQSPDVGYHNHPQLDRFKDQGRPKAALTYYMWHVFWESGERGYRFNHKKLDSYWPAVRIPVNIEQLDYEWEHFMKKIETRDPKLFEEHQIIFRPDVNPLFELVDGPIADWERSTK